MATGGVVAPLHGAPVHGRSGQCYEVDSLWPEKRLIVEVDGREWHLSPDDWESDLDRMTDLVDAGYRLLRFTAAAIRRRTNQTLATIRRQIAVPPPREVDQACG
jgi:very-short-patch-repair endonuclease